MGTKTLYVSDDDEKVWQGLKTRADGNDGSVSRIVTDALRAYLDAAQEADSEARDVTVSLSKAEQTTLINRLRQLLRRYGRDRVAVAYSRACYWEGAARSRSKGKGDASADIDGPVDAGRKSAGGKAAEGPRRVAPRAVRGRKTAGA
jgi:hypothetical protein